MDDFFTTVIATVNQLVDAEAASRQNPIIHRYDTEIQLRLDDDDDDDDDDHYRRCVSALDH